MLRPSALLLAASAALACTGDDAASAAPARPIGREVVFLGACDASGAVPLSERRMVVADDEDNVLRIYDVDRGGAPIEGIDVSGPLHLPLEGKKRKAPELDLEAATALDGRAYWLTSHGRDKKGEPAPERLRLFATALGHAEQPSVTGEPYDRLIEDLIAAPELAGYDLAAAAALAPKAAGGLNLEGLTAGPGGAVWLGFRNPVPRGRALLVPLLNLAALVDGGGPARFGRPVELDLGGRGVRSLSWWRGRYLIIAGDTAGGGTSALYSWDGRGPARSTGIELGGYNPEGFYTPEDRDEILVLSDDGERAMDGVACKKLKDPSRRQFRGVWLTLPPASR